MKLKKAMPLVLAVVLGLVAMVMARKLLKPPAAKAVASNTTPVVVAMRDVPPGKELTAEDLQTADIPTSVVPAQSKTAVSDLVGRVTVSPLVKGQAVLETLLSPIGGGIGITALVPEGMRAMTMNIDEITGIGGMLVPGSHVDINVMIIDEHTKLQTSRTILQDLKIVAVGKQLTPPSGDGPPAAPSNNVTFLVTPEQARILELAATTTRPWLVLRGGRDKLQVKLDHTSIAQLRGDGDDLPLTRPAPTTGPSESDLAEANAAAQRRAMRNVEVIRGLAVSTVSLPLPADLGGGGLPTRDTSSPGSDSADKPMRPAKPAVSRAGAEMPQSPRPSATSDVDQSDAFNHDPFSGGSSR